MSATGWVPAGSPLLLQAPLQLVTKQVIRDLLEGIKVRVTEERERVGLYFIFYTLVIDWTLLQGSATCSCRRTKYQTACEQTRNMC